MYEFYLVKMHIFNLNSAVGVDARPYDVEMIRGEGGAGHINKVICPSRLKLRSAQQIRPQRRIQLRNVGLT